jgi:molecular chaperone GrpE
MTDEKNNPENNIENIEDTIQDENQTEQNSNQEAENKIVELEEANNSLNDKLLRLAAELENTRRRTREEVDKANKYAVSNFANDLVLVVENFYLATDNLPAEEIEKSAAIKHFVEAMVMTKKELTKTLEKHGIKRIYPFNEKFDHNFHEAISQVPASDGEEDGIVKQVIQAGYSIGDRLIKPALVSVLIKS